MVQLSVSSGQVPRVDYARRTGDGCAVAPVSTDLPRGCGFSVGGVLARTGRSHSEQRKSDGVVFLYSRFPNLSCNPDQNLTQKGASQRMALRWTKVRGYAAISSLWHTLMNHLDLSSLHSVRKGTPPRPRWPNMASRWPQDGPRWPQKWSHFRTLTLPLLCLCFAMLCLRFACVLRLCCPCCALVLLLFCLCFAFALPLPSKWGGSLNLYFPIC
jgi:hypothetical protein